MNEKFSLSNFILGEHGLLLQFNQSFTKISIEVHTSKSMIESESHCPCYVLKKELVTFNYSVEKNTIFLPTMSDSDSPSDYIKIEILELNSQNYRNHGLSYLFCKTQESTKTSREDNDTIKSDLFGAASNNGGQALMGEGLVTLLQRGFGD